MAIDHFGNANRIVAISKTPVSDEDVDRAARYVALHAPRDEVQTILSALDLLEPARALVTRRRRRQAEPAPA